MSFEDLVAEAIPLLRDGRAQRLVGKCTNEGLAEKMMSHAASLGEAERICADLLLTVWEGSLANCPLEVEEWQDVGKQLNLAKYFLEYREKAEAIRADLPTETSAEEL